MAHDADHIPGKRPGIVRLSVARRDRRASLHGYAGKRTRSWQLEGTETRGIIGCCIRSKSSRFVVHSFREGNTRTQFVFFSQLAEQAGYRIDAAQFAVGQPLRDDFVNARFYSQATGSNERLIPVLERAISSTSPLTLEQRIQSVVSGDAHRKVDPAQDPGRTRRLKGYGR